MPDQRTMPSASTRRPVLGCLSAVVAAAIVATVFVLFVRPYILTWGASPEEVASRMTWNASVSDPAVVSTNAMTVKVPPDKVWPWLVEIGQDRAGFYSYTWLENLTTAGIRDDERLVPEWQTRRAGDFVPSARPQILGGRLADIAGWKVATVEPGQVLVLQGWGAFVLEPIEGGWTRFIIRTRFAEPTSLIGKLAMIFLFDPMHFVMQRRMMLRIRELAEERPGFPGWLVALAHLGWWLGAAAVALTFSRRGRWWWLIAPLAAAGIVLFTTGDVQGALAAFMGLGLALLGPNLVGWWYTPLWIIGLGVFTFAVLARLHDAYLVFGLVFGAVPIVAGVAYWLRSRRGALPRPGPAAA